MQNKCSFYPTKTDLSCKATNAHNSKIPFKLTHIKIALKILDACISPVLLYGSDVWCPFLNNDYMK